MGQKVHIKERKGVMQRSHAFHGASISSQYDHSLAQIPIKSGNAPGQAYLPQLNNLRFNGAGAGQAQTNDLTAETLRTQSL